jgi:hypothetical protein
MTRCFEVIGDQLRADDGAGGGVRRVGGRGLFGAVEAGVTRLSGRRAGGCAEDSARRAPNASSGRGGVRSGRLCRWNKCARPTLRRECGDLEAPSAIMRIADRYLLGEALGPFLVALGAFIVLITGHMLFQVVEVIVEHGVPLPSVLRFVALQVPNAAVMALPVSVLMGCSLAVNRLASDHEIVAMRSGGMSFARMMAPMWAPGAGRVAGHAGDQRKGRPVVAGGGRAAHPRDGAAAAVAGLRAGQIHRHRARAFRCS